MKSAIFGGHSPPYWKMRIGAGWLKEFGSGNAEGGNGARALTNIQNTGLKAHGARP
jgi:hypothetical protein